MEVREFLKQALIGVGFPTLPVRFVESATRCGATAFCRPLGKSLNNSKNIFPSVRSAKLARGLLPSVRSRSCRPDRHGLDNCAIDGLKEGTTSMSALRHITFYGKRTSASLLRASPKRSQPLSTSARSSLSSAAIPSRLYAANPEIPEIEDAGYGSASRSEGRFGGRPPAMAA